MREVWTVRPEDVAVLRELAAQVRVAVDSPRNQDCIALWHRHDLNRAERPLILTETDGGLQLVKPDLQLRCREEWARRQEYGLLGQLIHFAEIGDDVPLEPFVNLNWQLHISGYGVDQQLVQPKTDGTRGAFHIDAPIKNLAQDFHQLTPRTFAVDLESTQAQLQVLREVYDGIFGVRLRGNPWWTMGLTQTAIYLIGLEELMLYMYDEPEALHQLMAFLRDDFHALLDWMEAEELLSLNNENDYIGSGSRGYTRALPQQDGPVRAGDLWTLIESQETVGISPELYAEFIFPYEETIARRFGRIYYGCCEPLHTRWHVLQAMPNLCRVSISPWCDQAVMAEAVGSRYGYSRKPNPSLVSTESFDEDAIRRDLRDTMTLTHAHGCSTEIVMKDVHTLHDDPTRLARWVRMAREMTAEIYG